MPRTPVNQATTQVGPAPGTIGRPQVLLGMVVTETAGATAKVRVHDGADNTGPIIFTVSLAANAQGPVGTVPARGFTVNSGIFLETTAGSFEGSIEWT